ncbi:MAG TPA: Na(+)-translocating NADH-quinone reductase subunit A [Bacteroidales bacterium]|nr:Na(+)-translocating NADH-quinone reductase subunit A [Bacteroidales bacterium]
MSKQIKLKKGLNIRILGKADKILIPEERPGRYAIKPVDFPGLVPKLCIKPGDPVKAGSSLFFDKYRPEIKYASPVSGVVHDVVRGERRKILEVVIEAKGDDFEQFGKADPTGVDRDGVKEKLLQSGLWPAIRQRPYHIVADMTETPKAVFVSGFDTSPHGLDLDFIIDHLPVKHFNTGLAILGKLTDGSVHLSLSKNTTSPVLKSSKGVEIHTFSGPHPAGNVGIQIHHIDPVNKGEAVWYVNLQDVVAIGRLFNDGIYSPEKIIALSGSEVRKPRYYRTRTGACITSIVRDNINGTNNRYISGNVLTGQKIASDGFLGYYDSSICVIPEGNYHEFFGWISPGFKKYSYSRSFVSWMLPGKQFKFDTNLHGGQRAFVVTGEYERVLPMDIYPMQLLKAILVEDIDLMEKLGIYEIAEEDFALCEFICSSKIEIQSIVRKGLDLMVKEMS